MGTFNKYILKQVAASALGTVALFVFVLVLGNVVKASTTRDASRFSFLPDGWRALATQSVGRPR